LYRVRILEELGDGSTSTVYKGKYRGQLVAVKVLKETLDMKQSEDFKKELAILSELRSPHVVFFYGCVVKPLPSLVTEFLPNGSLYDVMTRPDIKIDWEVVITLSIESARAVNTLHCWKPQIMHRDLKSGNLLIDKNWTVKAADFGLARFKIPDNKSTLNKLRGTYTYSAPESYEGKEFTTKSDVYSYGIILWELITRCLTGAYHRPYSEYKNLKYDFQIIIQTSKNNLRPTVPDNCPPPFRDLISSCWDPDPRRRHEFNHILEKLLSLKELYLKEKHRKK